MNIKGHTTNAEDKYKTIIIPADTAELNMAHKYMAAGPGAASSILLRTSRRVGL